MTRERPSGPSILPADARDAPRGSLRWLVAEYAASPEFRARRREARHRHRRNV